MGMGFAPTWLRQVSPLLHMTTLTTGHAQNPRWLGPSAPQFLGSLSMNLLTLSLFFIF